MATKKTEAKETTSKTKKEKDKTTASVTKTSSRCGTRKKAKEGAIKAGSKFECTTCGLVVTVDTPCGCIEAHELICCGSPMTEK